LPQLSAAAAVNYQTLSYNYLTPKSQTPNGWNDYGLGTVNLDWELDFWGKNRAGLAAATSEAAAGRAELAQARLALAAAVADAYAELARLFAQHDIVARSVEVRKKSVELFSERFDNGLETKGGVSEAKARLAAVEGEQLAIEEAIGLRRNCLAALLGAGPDRGLTIARPKVNLSAPPGLPASLAVNLLGRRPDITAARLMAEAQAHRIDQAKAGFYPNVNLSAFLGFQSLGLDMLARRSSAIGGVGPAVYLPIFTAGRLEGQLRGTAAAYDAAVATYNGAVTRALREVADVGLSRRALTGELAKGEAAAQAAGEARQVAAERYRGGLATYLEVLYAEDVLLDVQRSLVNLQSRALTLDVALKRVLGGGYLNEEGK
jgi:NodT family efflux transporter outer membrane factor (OMF) lipoprotein